jgi:hypothetical protein
MVRMDAAAVEAQRKYARGQRTSRAIRDETGMDYSEILAGLGRLGLRPPVASFDGSTDPHCGGALPCCSKPWRSTPP